MTTHGTFALVVLAGLALPLPAADDLSEVKPYEAVAEGKPAAKQQTADAAEGKPRFIEPSGYLDFVFVANDRPVLLRMHLRNNGKHYSAGWDNYMQKLYAYLDKNGDGVLDKAETERAPAIQFLQYQLLGVIGIGYQPSRGQMGQFDTNKDGKVSLAEFRDFYRRGGFGPLVFFSNLNKTETDKVTKSIYKRLDANKDGKLSAEEMVQASAALRHYDLDENEMITADELKPGGEEINGFGRPFEFGSASPNADMGFLEIKPESVDGVSRQVLTRYDKDKNGKLSRAESGFDKPLFDQLDMNHDGQLDAKEYAGFFRRGADLELIARIGKVDQKEGPIAGFLRNMGGPLQAVRAEVFNPTKRVMPLSDKVRRVEPSAVAFSLGDANIGFSAAEQQGQQFPRQFYEQQFREADVGKKGVVDRKQAMGAVFLSQLFDLVDRDGDGKLTEKELKAFLDMQTQGAGSRVQLTITDEGRSLFDLLDEDSDSRLSLRELRSSWSRMQPLAKSDGGLSRQDIPRRLDVSVGQAQRRFRVTPRRPGATTVATRLKGPPMWFQKMDRNQDGDVSLSEFLGSDDDFRKIDANGDGLISNEEAQKYEEKLKKKKS
jgi:Ca2+-binding EF-hand superfamily protein